MVEQNKEILIAKIIGLLNGLDGEGTTFNEEKALRDALKAIKNNESLNDYIAFFDMKKNEYLPNCLTCLSPCGRSNDYYISKHEDNQKKEKELAIFLDNYNDNIPIDEVIYQLIRISW